MKIISRPQYGGKTTDLLAQFQADPLGIFIAVSSQEADRVARQCPPLQRDRVMSYHQWIHRGGNGMSMRNIYVDNVDQLLRSLLHLQDSRIAAVTFTVDQPEQVYDPEHDLPPEGACVREGDLVIRWDADQGWWKIEEGPAHRVGAVAWPFSREGIEMGKMYARRRAGNGS